MCIVSDVSHECHSGTGDDMWYPQIFVEVKAKHDTTVDIIDINQDEIPESHCKI